MAETGFPQNNLTWQIVQAAQKGGYSVGGFCVYNVDGVLAVIKAAERCKSPAIIQFFPWTIHFQGKPFIKYAADLAHAASVPISIHLDHCLEPADADLALECAFDSIMVDGSLFDEDKSIAYVKSVVSRAVEKGITIEAELGRMDGSEVGLPAIDLESVMTDPAHARRFVEETGIHFLAPSFGNVHGPYPQGSAEKAWDTKRLEDIYEAVGQDIPLVMHGTHPKTEELLNFAKSKGMVKINQNQNARRLYDKFIQANWGKMDITKVREQAVEEYSKDVERIMHVMLGSAGKAETSKSRI